jgi:HK97 family phage major capsid protein
VWVAHRNIYDKVRQFATANNYHAFWTDLGGGQPPNLLGQPAYKSSAMDGTLTALAENYVMVYGDFSNYVIVDRVGMSVELVPHLFGASRRPTGQRGLFMYWRVGAGSVNNSAFAMLDVT